MAVLNGHRKGEHSGAGAVYAFPLGVLEAPAMISTHESLPFIGNPSPLMGADRGEKQVTLLSIHQVVMLFAQGNELREFGERSLGSQVKLGLSLYRHR